MRDLINIIESLEEGPFDGVVYHCSPNIFDEFKMDSNRGIYFANDPDGDYGQNVYKCRVILKRPYYANSLDNFEIDRNILLSQGYDGRIVDYKDEADYEMYDIVAFFPNQIEILDIRSASKTD